MKELLFKETTYPRLSISYCLIFFLHVLSLSAFCQKRNLNFEHLGAEAGLSHGNVFCILQDTRGFMWFGTKDGLNKYDGYKFTVYMVKSAHPDRINNSAIKGLAEDDDGNIWIATTNDGLQMFDRNKDKIVDLPRDGYNEWLSSVFRGFRKKFMVWNNW